jgi:hypothetical protein
MIPSHISFFSDTKIHVTFKNLKKAGRCGLIREMELSFRKNLEVVVVNGEYPGIEGEHLNEDIKHILSTPKEFLVERYQQLSEIILPIQKTIDMRFQYPDRQLSELRLNRLLNH